MKPLYIFDLDGTLALIEHRRHYVERPSLKCYDCGGKNSKNCVQCSDLDAGWKANWDAFFLACFSDAPNLPIILILEGLRRYGAADIWIFSGRSDAVRLQTVEWLLKHTNLPRGNFDSAFGDRDVLYMRSEGDFTADDVLKKQWLDSMSEYDRKRLVAVFDDRDRVVKMWRDAGVTCLQVAPGEF